MTDECDYCEYECDDCKESFYCSCQYRNHDCKTEEYFNIEGDNKMEKLGPVESEIETPWAVRCWNCDDVNLIFMTQEFYLEQLCANNTCWICPRCFRNASWSDENYDKYLGEEESEIEDENVGFSPPFEERKCDICESQSTVTRYSVRGIENRCTEHWF